MTGQNESEDKHGASEALKRAKEIQDARDKAGGDLEGLAPGGPIG